MAKQPEGWTKGNTENEDEESILNSLKSISVTNKDRWIQLARHYKKRRQFGEAECAFLGARYCSADDLELMREWLGVYTLNRADSMPKSDILENANMVQECIFDIRRDPIRLASELQHVLFILDNPKQRASL